MPTCAGAEYLVVGAHAMDPIENKKELGRPRDLADVSELEEAGRGR